MSITRALAAAASGLTASARGTETVASNLSNMMTPGYGRREIAVTSDRLGGTRVAGVNRVVHLGLLAEVRAANAAQAGNQTKANYLRSMEQLVGTPGDPGSLGASLSEFQAALTSAAARPDDAIRLSGVVTTAKALATKVNAVGDGIQSARMAADAQIARDVTTLNDGLQRVADLNRQIVALKSADMEAAALEDERQTVIDGLASIVPMQQVARDDGKIALFTTGGAVLLDGMTPVPLGFQSTRFMVADMTLDNGTLGALRYDGSPMTPDRAGLFGGGSLEANFAIRDRLAPEMQREADALALDIYDRLADPTIDVTLAGQPGMFTDSGGSATVGSIAGLSSRLQVNALIVPSEGGDLWRIRAGLGASGPGPSGDSGLLARVSGVLSASRTMADAATFGGNASLEHFSGQLISRASTRRVGADSDLAVTNARSTTLTQRLMADGVDSDDEMRRLLQYEQAYSANAKVIQTIDEMLNSILRI